MTFVVVGVLVVVVAVVRVCARVCVSYSPLLPFHVSNNLMPLVAAMHKQKKQNKKKTQQTDSEIRRFAA